MTAMFFMKRSQKYSELLSATLSQSRSTNVPYSCYTSTEKKKDKHKLRNLSKNNANRTIGNKDLMGGEF